MHDYTVSDVVSKQFINNEEEKKQEITNITSTDISDVIIHKNYQLSLFTIEYPLFSLKLDKKITKYKFKSRSGTTITVNSTKLGRATIQDSDILLYCITKIMQLAYEDKTLTRHIKFTSYDYLKKTGRNTSGPNYQQIINSLERLSSTTLRTNKKVGDYDEVGKEFCLIDSFYCHRNKRTEKLEKIEVVLSKWLFNEIVSKKVVTINQKYLKLKPLEKRIYQLAKIHCYNSKSTEFSLNYFANKVGTKISSLKNFRVKIKRIQKTQPLPDFLINYDEKEDKVRFTLREQNDANKSQVKSRMKSKELRSKSQNEFIEKRIYEIAKIYHTSRVLNTIFTTEYFLKHLELLPSDSKNLKTKINKMQETQPLPEFLIHCKDDHIWFTLRERKQRDTNNINENKNESKIAKESEKELTSFNKIAQKFTTNTINPEAKILESTVKAKRANSTEIKEIRKQVRYVLKEIDKHYLDKKEAIFKANIFTEKKLFNYVKEFGPILLLDVIKEKADFDFSAADNPAGYFWRILENSRK